jgi:hypothetical protein
MVSVAKPPPMDDSLTDREKLLLAMFAIAEKRPGLKRTSTGIIGLLSILWCVKAEAVGYTVYREYMTSFSLEARTLTDLGWLHYMGAPGNFRTYRLEEPSKVDWVEDFFTSEEMDAIWQAFADAKKKN